MTEHVFEPMRRAMVASQLRTTGVNDPRVVEAMGEVPREHFVPPERLALAYADALVPLVPGRALNPPMALGRLLTEARLRGHEHALVIGAATGYAAAVLARLVASVVAVEEDDELLAFAREALTGTGVELVKGMLTKGDAKGAPYDFILIDGAVEQVPPAIVEQVRDGGTIALALLEDGVSRLAAGRVIGGAFGATIFADAATAALPGFQKPRTFSF
ncbi:MAG: protein-L-isoaspartate O-methyltransferase [Sphingomonadaceae bacterium]|nr:protein-L-isoaspartate O-methyltransferase [Sphingomonadaceae bacterium]